MTARRGRLLPKTMEALQVLKFSIKKGRSLTFTQGTSWKDELMEFELLARTEPVGDADAYGRSLEESGEDSDKLMEAMDDITSELEMFDKRKEEKAEEEEEDDDEGEEREGGREVEEGVGDLEEIYL
jgi:hypothetical protein